MRIFIDESGLFMGYHAGSISVAAALVIPDSSMKSLRRKYQRIRPSLPKEDGEVKGKLLSASEIDRAVQLLAQRHALFEVNAIDFGLHNADAILAYRQKLANETRAGLPNIPQPLRDNVASAVDYVETSRRSCSFKR